MQKKFKIIIGNLLMIIGVVVLIMPIIMQKVTTNLMDTSIKNFAGVINELSENDTTVLDELYKKMKEYNENLYLNGQTIDDMLAHKNTDFDLTEYGIEENIIGSIIIPKINVEIPIYLGATKENLNKGATHLSQTSLPLGEINSNVVIAAHRGLIRNQMFRNIHKLKAGDIVQITNMWNTLDYEVCDIEIIEPTDVAKVLIQEGSDMITLITCHPYRVNTHRYVVYCERIK